MYNFNLKKKDLVKNLSSETGFSLNFSKKIIDDLSSILIECIKTGYLSLKNVGTFKVIHKKKRIGRNPKTKEEFLISSRKSVSFTASKKISEKVGKLI